MKSSKPSLYLHIGVHRTGTTSIQSYLEASQEQLLEGGVLVPFGQGRPFQHSKGIRTREVSASAVGKEILADLQSRGVEINSVIFSEEDICQTETPALFAGLADHFDVKVVIFLRRQDQWLESWFQQNIKGQWNPDLANISFGDFYQLAAENKFFWIDYHSLAANWAGVFGRENLLLRVMERSRMPNGPVHEFMAAMGCENMYDEKLDVHKNSSFSPRVSELVRNLSLEKYKELKVKRLILKASNRVSRSMADKGVSILSPEQRQEILQWYAQSNQLVAREYFGREQLFDNDISKPFIPWPEIKSSESAALIEEVVEPLILALAKDARNWREKAERRNQRQYSKSFHLKAFFRLLLGKDSY